MDNREFMTWLRDELKGLREDVGDIKVTLVAQHASLDEHIRRTNLLESRVEQVAESVKPIQDHVAGLRTVWRWVKGLGMLAGTAAAVVGLWKMVA